MSSPYLLQNRSIWKSLEDYPEQYTGRTDETKRKNADNNDHRWVLISVRDLSEENRSMDPHFGGGGVTS